MTRQEYSQIVSKSLHRHAIRRFETKSQYGLVIEAHNANVIEKLRNEARNAA